MSTIKVPVVEIQDIRAHSNPEVERLELATVEGWQLAIPKGRYRNGDRVVYFEQGTTIPRELADQLGVTAYLSEKTDIEGVRRLVIHRIKLKGEPSFGLAIEVPPELVGVEIGMDVASFFGVQKYQPPVRAKAGDAESPHPLFPTYTDIENMRSYPHVFSAGEPVVMTEKIHGTSGRVAFVREDGVMLQLAGSRTQQRKQPDISKCDQFADVQGEYFSNTYWMPWAIPEVLDLMDALYEAGHKQAALYGEVFGSGVQSYDYGQKRLGFRAFDLMIDGKYLPYAEFFSLCNRHQVEVVPLLYAGPFSMETIAAHSNGDSLIGGTHGREGGVVRPAYEERDDPQIGRVILKYVGDHYLFSKSGGQRDTTDV